MVGSGGDEQVAASHRRGLRATLFGTAGAFGAMGIINLISSAVGGGGAAAASTPGLITGIQTILQDATGWLLALVPIGGGLIAGYHWFMTGPGSE